MPYSVSVPITRQHAHGGQPTRRLPDCACVDEPRHDPEEQVAIVDEPGRVVGSAPRSVMRRDNLPHVVVAVLVRDPAGRVYVHRRTDTKDVFPGMHDCFAAGCLQATARSRPPRRPARSPRSSGVDRRRRSTPLFDPAVRRRVAPGTCATRSMVT